MNQERAERLLSALTPAGITANQARLFWSCAWETADKLLRGMAEKGLLWPQKLGNGSIGYYPSQKDAEAATAERVRLHLTRARSSKTAAAPPQIVVPAHVKVQICPAFEGDYRIKADGSMPAGFVAEWHALRGQI